MGIKKFKRDAMQVVYQYRDYEIVEQHYDNYPIDYSLKKKDDDESWIEFDFDALIPFLTAVLEEDIPFAPLPVEEQEKIKPLLEEKKKLQEALRSIESQIERLKDGYEDA